MSSDNTPNLAATYFLDFTDPSMVEYGNRICKVLTTKKEKAIHLFLAVRDDIRYDPYHVEHDRQTFKASAVLKKGSGYCGAKAVLLTALGRQQGIPSRLGFSDVRNHLSTKRLSQLMGTDIFYYHGYTEFFLNGRWIKATPAFNIALCQRFKVKPLEFDGINDSVFHEYRATGERHMEYLRNHGSYMDLPFDEIFACYFKRYPKMFNHPLNLSEPGDFHREAEEETP